MCGLPLIYMKTLDEQDAILDESIYFRVKKTGEMLTT